MLSPVISNNLSTLLKRIPSSGVFNQRVQLLHNTCSCQAKQFFQRHPKSIYWDEEGEERHKKLVEYENRKEWYGLKNGFKLIRDECWKLKDEWHERLTDDHELMIMPGDREELFRFDTPEALDKWEYLTDSDHNEGYSRCSLGLSPKGKGLFQGFIDAKVPIDGKQHRAGFASFKTKRKIKSFYRHDVYDWESYSHLVMRVRGDGRVWMVNLNCAGTFDVEWNDIWHYPLYTRGGPYWQFVKIPFSKFILAHKGRVQDDQCPIPTMRINSVGFTISKIEGPFSLEVDFVGVECDPVHEEEFAYEMYALSNGIASV